MAVAAPAAPSRRWLYGPVPDLVLGCGVGYMALFAALVVAGAEVRAVLPLGLLPLVSVFAGTPHYGATLLRVYEQASERRAYVFFTVYLTAVVWAFYAIGLYHAAIGTFLLTLYLTWSPWHYTGQNYGIAIMFLRRRGVELAPGTKRLVWLSFVFSYFLTFVAIHGSAYSADYAPVESYSGSIYAFRRLGIPSPWWQGAFVAVGVAYLAALGAAAWRLLRVASARDLFPVAVIAATQLLWFSLPPLGRELGLLAGVDPFAPNQAAFVFVWVAAGHAVQYLWVTTYYAGVPRGARLRYYARCVFAGSAIWSLPVIAYTWSGLAGSRLGGVASGADAGVLLAAMVNIHHFMLDGAIWKLRDGRVARMLIRREPADAGERPEPFDRPRRRWLAPALLGAGALWTLSTIGSLAERHWHLAPALEREDWPAAHASLDRLAWIQRDSMQDYVKLAQRAAQAGDDASAFAALERGGERFDAPGVWMAKGSLLERRGRSAEAATAFEMGLRRAPDHAGLLQGLGRMRLAEGRVDEAIALLERAREVAPGEKRIELTLERAQRMKSGAADATTPSDA